MGRTTQDVLLKTTEDWRQTLDENKVVATAVLDLSRAFDSINHKLLVVKMLCYAIQEGELVWFRDYLEGRRQTVVVDGTSSRWLEIRKGVPQGSALGPLLFLLFLNNLPAVVSKCSINLFADDTSLYTSACDQTTLSNKLQRDLDKVVEWTKSNGLMQDKCLQVQINGCCQKRKGQSGKFYQSHCRQCRTIHVNQRSVPRGGHRQGTLLGKTYQQNSQELHAKLAWIRRTTQHLPMRLKKVMYQALLLPHLDYCAVVWNTYSRNLTNKVERIQNYALCIILSKPPLTSSSLKRMGWTTLEVRRKILQLVQVCRCVSQEAPHFLCQRFQLNSNLSNYANTRGLNKLRIPRVRMNFLHNSFTFQGSQMYNSLEKEIREIKRRNTFKTALICMTINYLNI